MKLMIEIPEEDYIRLRDEGMFGNVTTFKRAVREGILLEQEPCEDAISREEVHNLIVPWLNDYLLDETREALETIDYKIGDLPPVTPQYTDAEIQKMQDLEFAEVQKAYELGKAEQPKMGRWIIVDKGLKVTSFKCSECGRTVRDDTGYDVTKDYPYCHCGAKMQEVQK